MLFRFNRTFREDVLDAYSFDNLDEVCLITEWGTKGLISPVNTQLKMSDFVYLSLIYKMGT